MNVEGRSQRLFQRGVVVVALALLTVTGCGKTVRSGKASRLRPAIVSRAEWGSKEITSGYRTHRLERITLHHSGVYYDGKTPAAEKLRNLQAWSRRDRPWVDIPYHFLIDLEGRIYEGRPLQYVGDTNTSYDPTGHVLISVMGNYEEQPFLPVQQQAVVQLVAWLSAAYNLSPDSLRGHKDYDPTTDCPGKNIYPLLQDGTLVRQVKAFLKSHR